MSRRQAWLEKRNGAYGIRFHDPEKPLPDGTFDLTFRMIDGGLGQRVKSKIEAMPYLLAKLATLPASDPQPGERHTLQQIAARWKAMHPDHSAAWEYVRAIDRICAPTAEKGMGVTYPVEITKARIEEYEKANGFKGTDRPLAYVRSVLRWAQTSDLMPQMSFLVDQSLAPPQSTPSNYRLLTEEEWRKQMVIARRWGHEALAHCLSLYGWRPVTACLAKVGMVDLKRRWIGPLHVKQTRKGKTHIHEHRLFSETCDLLAPLVEGRRPEEPLFLHHDGGGWTLYKRRALQLVAWYRNHCQRVAPDAGCVYAWKRFAVARMDRGDAPWPLQVRDCLKKGFTGHATEAILKRYSATNGQEQDALTEELYVVEDEPVVRKSESGVAVVWTPDEAGQGLTEHGQEDHCTLG